MKTYLKKNKQHVFRVGDDDEAVIRGLCHLWDRSLGATVRHAIRLAAMNEGLIEIGDPTHKHPISLATSGGER